MTKMQKIKSFLFENTSTKQTVAKNTFWLFVGEIISRLLRASIIIYAARMLGAEGWGTFSYALTIAAIFSIFADIGINPILTREGARNPELREKYLSTSFFIKITLLLLSAFLIIFVAPHFTKIEAAKPLLSIVALILALDGLREFGLSLNRALEKMEREAMTKIATDISIATLGFIFLIMSATAKSLSFAYVIGDAIGLSIIIWSLRSYFKNLASHFSRKLLWPIFSSAWPFTLTGFLGTIMTSTDTIMLGWFKSAHEVGFYSAAQRPIQFFYALPNLMASAMFPAFSKLAKKDNAKFKQILEKSIALIFMISLPITIGGIILGKEVMQLFFGNEYLPAAIAFQLLITTILITFPNTLINSAIFAYDEQKQFIYFLAFGSISNVAMNYFLIPRYGISGAAISTIIAQILSSILIWSKMKKINNFTVMPYLKNFLIATFTMGALALSLRYLNVNLFMNIILSSSIYFGILALLKEPILKELRSIIRPDQS